MTLWRWFFFRFFSGSPGRTSNYVLSTVYRGVGVLFPVPSWKIPILSSLRTRITIHKYQLIMTNRTCMLLAGIDWDEKWERWPKITGNTLLSQFTGNSFHWSRRTRNGSFPVHREYIFVIPVHRKYIFPFPNHRECKTPFTENGEYPNPNFLFLA